MKLTEVQRYEDSNSGVGTIIMEWKYGLIIDNDVGGVFVAEVYSDGCYGKLTADDWRAESAEEMIETIKMILKDLEDE
jgi:hypothetical protein